MGLSVRVAYQKNTWNILNWSRDDHSLPTWMKKELNIRRLKNKISDLLIWYTTYTRFDGNETLNSFSLHVSSFVPMQTVSLDIVCYGWNSVWGCYFSIYIHILSCLYYYAYVIFFIYTTVLKLIALFLLLYHSEFVRTEWYFVHI